MKDTSSSGVMAGSLVDGVEVNLDDNHGSYIMTNDEGAHCVNRGCVALTLIFKI